MSVEAHRRSQSLVEQAERFTAKGRTAEASGLYRQAADEEARAFDTIPLTRPRTRGIIAVSAVALYSRAGALGEVVRHARCYLEQPELPAFAREQLVELLGDAQQALPSEPSGTNGRPDAERAARQIERLEAE